MIRIRLNTKLLSHVFSSLNYSPLFRNLSGMEKAPHLRRLIIFRLFAYVHDSISIHVSDKYLLVRFFHLIDPKKTVFFWETVVSRSFWEAHLEPSCTPIDVKKIDPREESQLKRECAVLVFRQELPSKGKIVFVWGYQLGHSFRLLSIVNIYFPEWDFKLMEKGGTCWACSAVFKLWLFNEIWTRKWDVKSLLNNRYCGYETNTSLPGLISCRPHSEFQSMASIGVKLSPFERNQVPLILNGKKTETMLAPCTLSLMLRSNERSQQNFFKLNF